MLFHIEGMGPADKFSADNYGTARCAVRQCNCTAIVTQLSLINSICEAMGLPLQRSPQCNTDSRCRPPLWVAPPRRAARLRG